MNRGLSVSLLLLVVNLLVQNAECENNRTQEHIFVGGIDVDILSDGELFLLDAEDEMFLGQLDIWIGKQVDIKNQNGQMIGYRGEISGSRSRSWSRGSASRRSGSGSRSWSRGSASRRSGSGSRSWSRGSASRRSGSGSRSWSRGSASRRSGSGSRSWSRGSASRRSGSRSRRWAF